MWFGYSINVVYICRDFRLVKLCWGTESKFHYLITVTEAKCFICLLCGVSFRFDFIFIYLPQSNQPCAHLLLHIYCGTVVWMLCISIPGVFSFLFALISFGILCSFAARSVTIPLLHVNSSKLQLKLSEVEMKALERNRYVDVCACVFSFSFSVCKAYTHKHTQRTQCRSKNKNDKHCHCCNGAWSHWQRATEVYSFHCHSERRVVNNGRAKQM